MKSTLLQRRKRVRFIHRTDQQELHSLTFTKLLKTKNLFQVAPTKSAKENFFYKDYQSYKQAQFYKAMDLFQVAQLRAQKRVPFTKV